MKAKVLILSLLLAAGIYAFGWMSGETHAKLSPQTATDLSTAMHGEAFAYAKYMLYAQHARDNGNPQLAKLFEDTAKIERLQHMREEAELVGLIGSDADNLRDSIKGESYEVDTMYREFATKARAAGDKAAADRFEEIRRDEMGHRDAFQAALNKLQKQTAMK